MSGLVDQFGVPIPRERVRRALGFIERHVRAEEGDVASGVTPGRSGGPFPGFQTDNGGWDWKVPCWCEREGQS